MVYHKVSGLCFTVYIVLMVNIVSTLSGFGNVSGSGGSPLLYL